MRKALLVTVISLMGINYGFTQGKQGAAVANSGAGASGSSNQLTPQPGFVYSLKDHKHIQYAATKTETMYVNLKWIYASNIKQLFDTLLKPERTIVIGLRFDRVPLNSPSAEPFNLGDYFLTKVDVNVDYSDSGKKARLAKDLNWDADTVAIVKIQYYDSIPRYGNIVKHHRYDPNFLRLSITQDSAILVTKILNTAFSDGARVPDTYNVTNAYFYNDGQVPVFDDYGFSQVEVEGDTSIELMDSLRYQPIRKKYDRAGGSEKLSLLYQLAAIYNNHFRPDYLGNLSALGTMEPFGHTANFADFKAKVKGEYGLIRDRFFEIQSLYSTMQIFFFNGLDETLKRWRRRRPGDNMFDAVQFIDKLSVLEKQYPYPLIPLPPSTLDEMVPETAIPISKNDSANNFYFKILQKKLVSQTVYYQSFHYSTYDYGTLTIPLRYRFSPKHHYVYTVNGKDSTGLASSSADATINLSVYGGRKWGRTHFYENPTQTHNTVSFEAAVFLGPTLVALSASNVDTSSTFTGAKRAYTYSGPSNIIAVTAGAGGVLQWRTFNIGLFGGWDFPLIGEARWVYAHKFWLGFGIGVNLGMFNSGKSVY
jgi:hypothetical protein